LELEELPRKGAVFNISAYGKLLKDLIMLVNTRNEIPAQTDKPMNFGIKWM
jgi:hypothetical protein